MTSRTTLLLAPLSIVVAAGCSPGEVAGFHSRSRPIILGQGCAAEPEGALAVLLSATAQYPTGSVSALQISCGGTLIAPDVVLTAGHCVQVEETAKASGLSLKDIKLYVTRAADLSRLKTQPQGATLPADAVEVSWRAPHTQFDIAKLAGTAPPKGLGSLHDIGVMFLSRAMTGVEPAVVIAADEAQQLALNTPLTIVGWGRTSAQKPSPFAPPEGGERRCAESFINEIGPWEMQVGGDGSTPRKCQGDSGGPSYATVSSPHRRRSRVVGVTSRAYDPAQDCAMGGIDTRVDPHRDWLESVMREGCAGGTRVWCQVPGLVPAAYYDPPAPALDGAPAGDADLPAAGEGGCRLGGRPEGTGWPLLLGLLALARRRRGSRREG